MAKPGSDAARAIAGGARILSDGQARELQEHIELKLAARCNGCGRRIGVGFKFTSIDPRDSDERHVISYMACTRADCDFALKAKEVATFVETVEFKWLDSNGVDAPPALAVVRRNERMAAAEGAAGNGSG